MGPSEISTPTSKHATCGPAVAGCGTIFLMVRNPLTRRPAPAGAATRPVPPVASRVATVPGTGNVLSRPLVRAGAYAWALLGLVGVLLLLSRVATELKILTIPLVLALFPAAILAPPTAWLKRRMPDTAAAAIVVLLFVAIISLVVTLLANPVTEQLGGLVEEAQNGAMTLQTFLANGPFGFAPVRVGTLLDQLQEQVANTDGLGARALGAAAAVLEGFAGLVLVLVALFFYLKDGPQLAAALRDLFPERARADVEEIATRSWQTVGAYIRGQSTVALVDALAIGSAILILRVPLALPLIVITFVGGLIPIVGAFVSGLLAVLVALATTDLRTALILLAVIIAVQQLEGHLLAPLVLSRAVNVHPLIAIIALAAGSVVLGVLGAFLSLPVAASIGRTIGYLRDRPRDPPPEGRPIRSPA